MAAIVCHGLSSCLDSQLVESRIHNLRLPSPKPLTPQPIDLPFKSCFWESNNKPNCEDSINKSNALKSNSNEDSWSSIQALSKSNVFQVTKEKEQNYVDPNVKLSWLQLSPKSLELCTENLGNETGTDIPESGFEFFSSTTIEEKKEQRKSSCQNLVGEKVRTKNFPPPLKSMRGSESLRVRPHREDGRLVIEVTKVPSSGSCFQAERSNGRLRLSFWSDSQEDVEDNQDFEEELKTQMSEKREDDEEEGEEEEEEKEEKEETLEESIDNENEEGKTRVGECIIERKVNGWNIESEVRMENYERGSRRRCKEGKHENNEMLVNWGEPIWLALATS